MEVIPAIDLKDGRCVRLFQGDFNQETVFSDDPLAMALSWQEQGAHRLHVVDLDGAIQGKPTHLDVISAIVRALDIPIQVGGGIRDIAAADAWLGVGVDRVVIGTAAVRDPDMVVEACKKHGRQRVVVSVDAKEGLVALHGWKESSNVTVLELANQMADIGVVRLLYTDIARDGALTGPDFEGNKLLAEESGLAVLASGGIASVQHIKELLPTGVEGVIVGRALYTGAVDLAEAVRAAS
ncbi:MAG: 1-(5-phosphoribosyl)-5-[(5-phosphoribosylamino)methylideneamino]imidazole-4-carboxamide isomerase [SAR202 cluster bacterium]|jgi:phosphoribosylformimino-5-aminoimidazole carboxamide ribotide isomerase|nr:1-(5-phosphoribosyl)-5-[(5-phosphoribosylamino)methylideneamino]imidazole-4-carboxamide isomerase [Dehalococcoidia bacterium]MQF90278.1 1-(5-phosphoribosyl)-5-[(5-phosphoribosylamino)methylideneamino]imidazole-4-carboxamide isomerase [SAR202 cluster bacterium]|tara:strand:+ start:1658 stop:2374 length:717 start_codon:yes stop_codon:yes gene_type:complete